MTKFEKEFLRKLRISDIDAMGFAVHFAANEWQSTKGAANKEYYRRLMMRLVRIAKRLIREDAVQKGTGRNKRKRISAKA